MEKKILSLLSSFILYFIILGEMCYSIVESLGKLTYPLDDTYIHMAISKNLAEYGTWGINPHEFSSASSSPLFTLLLALYFFLFGVNELAPLIINIIISLFLIYFVWDFFKNKISNLTVFFLLSSIIIFTPLPNMSIIAMEHILHALLSLLYIFVLWKITSGECEKKNIISYVIISFFLPISRYEGLFLIIGGGIILLFKQKYKLSLLSFIAAALSVSIIGIYFIYNGGTFFPYSVIVKSNLAEQTFWAKIIPFKSILNNFIWNKWSRVYLTCFIILIAFSLFTQFVIMFRKRKIDGVTYVIFAFLINLFLYISFARFGWLNRYEAFLFPMVLSLFFYSVYQLYPFLIKNITLKKKMLLCLMMGLFLLYPLIRLTQRSVFNYICIKRGSEEIYYQQYQTAKFIKKYYENQSVGINDIGYPSFFSNSYIVDMFGLGNKNIALSKKLSEEYLTKVIRTELKKKNVNVIFIYKNWFEPNVYKGYTEIGSWKLSNCCSIVANSEVTVYSSNDPKDLQYLIRSLKEFNKKELPSRVNFIWNKSYDNL